MPTKKQTSFERIIGQLGGWPDHFTLEETQHGESFLSFLKRDKSLDEISFGLVVRYVSHRAAYDRLSKEISDQDFTVIASNYLSGAEQSRAFHENKLLTLERELLATPYARAKSGKSTQSSFLDELDFVATEDGQSAKVMPFKPMAKRKVTGS